MLIVEAENTNSLVFCLKQFSTLEASTFTISPPMRFHYKLNLKRWTEVNNKTRNQVPFTIQSNWYLDNQDTNKQASQKHTNI